MRKPLPGPSIPADGEDNARESWSRRALDALPDPVVVMDGESRILLANRRARDLLLSGSHDTEARRSAAESNFRLLSVLTSGSRPARPPCISPEELALRDPDDGSDLLFEVSVLPLHSAGGTPGGSVALLRDVTELKRKTVELEAQANRSYAAEHQAWQDSTRLNVIIENAGVPIVVTDRNRNVMLMNHEAEHLLETGPGDVRAVLPMGRDIRANEAKLAGFINDFLGEPGLRRERRLTLVDPDEAREFPAVAVSTKILDEGDEAVAVVTVVRDLTQEVENQHLAEELRKLNEELEERVGLATRALEERTVQLEAQRTELERASRMKSEFLAIMSHELRTPINAILGYNSLLRDGLFGDLGGEQSEALRRMRRAAEHLLSVINDILDLSRVEAGKMQLSVSDVDLASLFGELSDSVSPMAAQKSLAFTVEVEPGMPAVRTDEMRLRQILLNLLSNAVKFTDAGSVTLRASLAPEGDGACLEVSDTGIGIAKEKLDAIFEAFTQVDQSSTRQHGGAGLGLTISRRFIRVMGGEVTVSSVVGVGTTFRVDLPLAPPPLSGNSDVSG